jgi:hypothetical protein
MSVIRWEAPAASTRGTQTGKDPVGHELIAVQLRRRPGDWALIHEMQALPVWMWVVGGDGSG